MRFQCSFAVWANGYGYTCIVDDIFKTTFVSNKLLISGDHNGNKSNDDVASLWIENKSLETFTRKLPEKFSSLTKLIIKGCGLKKILRADLIGLKNLNELNLKGNGLSFLPDDLFADMRMLEILILDKNELTSLPDDLLAHTKKLRRISFLGNKLERLSSQTLKPVEESLENADFRQNSQIDDYFNKAQAGKNNLKRLMDIMDSLDPPLPGTDPEPKLMMIIDRQHGQYQQMTAKLAEFKARGEFTDFTIKVRGKEFKVHKNILAAQSPVFRQTFTNDDGTTEQTFRKVKNFSEESFESFLDFFYTGKVGDEINALEVFELAAVFEVAILKEICSDKISATISQANSIEVFNLAHQHNSDRLKGQAFKVIQKLLPELPDKMVDNLDHVNKIVTARREFDALLEATEKL